MYKNPKSSSSLSRISFSVLYVNPFGGSLFLEKLREIFKSFFNSILQIWISMYVIGPQQHVFILLIQKNPMILSLQYGKNQHMVDVEDQESSIPLYHLSSSEKISQRLYMLILLVAYL